VVLAKATDCKTKDALNLQTCYLVEKGRNVMFTYSQEGLKQFHFDPTKQNMVWAITRDLKVAVMTVEQFNAAQNPLTNQMDLQLNVIDKKFQTPTEVQEYLEI
jgi:hypothetical protein